jgi:hypothetical protein
MNVDADRGADRAGHSDVTDAEEDLILLEVRATKDAERTADIEK